MLNVSSMTGFNIFHIEDEEFYCRNSFKAKNNKRDVEINHTIVTRGLNCAAAEFTCGIDCKGGVALSCPYIATGIGGGKNQKRAKNGKKSVR